MVPRNEIENKKIRLESKGKIIAAAIDLFSKQGYHPTSIREIANKAGVSKGLIYNYFLSKEDLLKEVVLYAYEEAAKIIFQSISPQLMEKEFPEIIRKVLNIFVKLLKENEELWKMSIALSIQVANIPSIQKMINELFEGVYEQIENLLIQKGRKDAYREARFIAATMDGIALHYLVLGKNFKLEEVKNKFIETFYSAKELN